MTDKPETSGASELSAEALLDSLVGSATAETTSAETTSAEATPETQPAVIEPGDPEGRQPGDPNAPIDLPIDFLTPTLPRFKMFASDGELTEADLAKLLPAGGVDPPREHDVVTSKLGQPPVLTDRTIAELNAGKQLVAVYAAAHPDQSGVAPPAPVVSEPQPNLSVFDAANSGVARPPAQAPVITDQTRAEMEAGRRVVERKTAEVDRGRQIMVEHNARRLRDGAPPDAGDLTYTVPKG